VHPPEFVREYLDTPGHVFLRAQNVRPASIENREPVFVDDDIYRSCTEAIVNENDLLLVRTGANLGDLARVTADWAGAMVSSHTLRLVPHAGAPVYSLEYFFCCKAGRDLLLSLRSGGTHGQINASTLQTQRLPELRAIEPTMRAKGSRIAALRKTATTAINDAERVLVQSLALESLDLSPSLHYSRPFRDLLAARRFGAEYFMPAKLDFCHFLEVGFAKMPEKPHIPTFS
jgi:hypothetical protein